ncbi:putative phytosulfokine [Trifolium repens]|nr:putative phytosulfokine [Trifolium repens]
MSKLATFFSLALLLSFSLTYSSRPNLGFKGVSNSLHEDHVDSKASSVDLEDESCDGVEGEQECLTRRTLEAHLDYIYTQHKPKN